MLLNSSKFLLTFRKKYKDFKYSIYRLILKMGVPARKSENHTETCLLPLAYCLLFIHRWLIDNLRLALPGK